MDISSVSIVETSTLVVRHPQTGMETDITIELAGTDTAAYKKAVGAITKRANKRKNKVSTEEVEEMSIELLVAATVDWKNLEEGGKKLPFSKENATKIYSSIPWLRKQVDAFVGDEQNFLQSEESN